MKQFHPLLAAVGVGGLLAGAFVAGSTGGAADHLDSPLVAGNPQTDVNDLYAFVSPENPNNTVLIMTVNPAAGVLSPTTFDPQGKYDFQIDNDGDAKKDQTITVKFGESVDGVQSMSVKGVGTGKARGTTGETIGLANGGRAYAGIFDDPFFFDLEAFLVTTGRDPLFGANGGFCATDPAPDFFAGLDVSAIVVEVPSASLTDGSPTINVWAETQNESGRIDRMGKPAIATVLIDDGNENAYNATKPHEDVRRWTDEVSNNLQALSGLDGDGYDAATADFIASEVLLPDVLTLDTTDSSGFVPGLNGRQLADDVIDFELAVVTGLLDVDSDGDPTNDGPVLTTDCVDANDVEFPGGFPYLASAHGDADS